MVCSLTGLPCLPFCGGPRGNRCPIAPPYRNPAARAGVADTGARSAAGSVAPGTEPKITLAQLTADPGARAEIRAGLRAGTALASWIDKEIQRLITEERRREEMQRLVRERQQRQREELRRRQTRLPYAGITVGELTGWRIWRVDRRGEQSFLKSFAMEIWWEPGVPMTGDPLAGSMEGVWAFKRRIRALEKLRDAMVSRRCTCCAYGRVALWGEVTEHADGWRAENARIIDIAKVFCRLPGATRSCRYQERLRLLVELRARYRVDGVDGD